MPKPDATQAALESLAQQPQHQPMLMLSKPGIVRDGTRFSRNTYTDGQWNRFWLDKPKKMGGYRELVRDMDGVGRHLNLFNNNGFCYVHCGSTEAFERFAIYLPDGTNTGLVDRTPVGYTPDANNLWQSDNIFEAAEGTTHIFAVPLPSLNDITSETQAQVYHGDVLTTDPLAPAMQPIPASTDFVALLQTLAGAGNLVLSNTTLPDGAGNVTVTTDGNLSGVNFTITGLDLLGAPLVVGPDPLPDTTTLDVGAQFSEITTVALDGGTGTDQVSVGYADGETEIMTSGGLVVVGPYLFLYGHAGVVQWSVPGHPHDFDGVGAGDARPVSDKIVRGMPLRGQSAPAILLWSLSSLIVGNFVGTGNIWNFYTVTTSGSLLSQNGIVEHNGIYYWANTNGFSMYAGTMQDIKNEYNQQYFLDHLNYAARQKVFAFKVPRWKEIWWCFPFDQSDECNHAVILNYEKGYWYDTPLPNSGRGAGYYDVTYRFPIMTGVTTNDDTAGTSIWQHETGVDEISGPVAMRKAIKASYSTQEYNLILPDNLGAISSDQQMSFATMEPDFNQVGNLTMEVYSRASARNPTFSSPPTAPYVITPEPTPAQPDGVTFRWTGRLTHFKITSNVAGGDYFAGVPLIHVKPDMKKRVQ